MSYCVIKQLRWPNKELVVEVVTNDDFTNPGPIGYIEKFELATDAAQRAIELQQEWQQEHPGEEVFVGHGYRMGRWLHFESEEPEELLAWAKGRDDSLHCCDQCGTKISDEKSMIRRLGEDTIFCQEYCAEQYELENTPCTQCYEPVGEKPYWINGWVFCSEKCSDEYDDLHEDD
jgi:hypothetical protein